MRRKFPVLILAVSLMVNQGVMTVPVMADTQIAGNVSDVSFSCNVLGTCHTDKYGILEKTNRAHLDENSVSALLAEESGLLKDQQPGVDFVSNQAFTSADSKEDAENIANQYGGTLLSYENGIAVIGFDGNVVDVLENVDITEGKVDAVIHPDYYMAVDAFTVNDPSFATQYFHDLVHDSDVWNITTGSGSTVAVIDTGVDSDHDDLKTNLKTLKYTSNVSGVEDVDGHGTHTAGIVGAVVNNGIGGAGVAPGTDLEIIRVGTTKTITISSMIQGIRKAIEDDVDVINVSLGILSNKVSSDVANQMQEVINEAYEAGITVVAAAGNNSSDVPVYPAALDHVISVGAIDNDGNLGWYSSYGSWVDVAAPGTSVYSTFLNGKYGQLTGTSMAAPVVAGAAALIYANHPSYLTDKNSKTVDEVTQLICNSTDGESYSYGTGAEKRTLDKGCIDLTKAVTGQADAPQEDSNKDSSNDDSNVPNNDSVSKDIIIEKPDDYDEDNTDTISDNQTDYNGETPSDNSADEADDTQTEIIPPDDDQTASVSSNHADTPVTKTVSMDNGACLKYVDNIPYSGGKLKARELDAAINYGGVDYKIKSAKIKNAKHAGTVTVIIKKLDTPDKEINKMFKGTSFSFDVKPFIVSSNNVNVTRNAKNDIKKVQVEINGVMKKVSKSMYSYDGKWLIFSDDYKGMFRI